MHSLRSHCRLDLFGTEAFTWSSPLRRIRRRATVRLAAWTAPEL